MPALFFVAKKKGFHRGDAEARRKKFAADLRG